MADFPYAQWLARDYKRRAESSGKWTDYVKAHGLANFCVVKDSTEERRKLVYNIEESWYKGKHPLSYDEHQQLIVQHKSLLKSYRDVTRNDYRQLEEKVKCFDRNDILSEENLKLAHTFAKQVFATSEKCSNGLKELSGCVMQSSVDILQCAGSTAPCKFAVIGLGSLAKGEATPYSDLEYAFIVEQDDGYFERLAIDSYFRVGNLGETPLRYFDIAELTTITGHDNASIIADDIAAGYRIDGLMEKAGNIPTGNGRDGCQTLTLTVDAFIELYKSSAEAPFDEKKPGDLSDLLSSSEVIYTNEGQMSQLHHEFNRRRQAFELHINKNSKDVYKKRYQTLIMDIKSGTFSPDFIKFQPPKNFGIKLKRDIFRYPTLLANNTKILLRLDICCSWEVFSHLHTQGILARENYRRIEIVLAFAIYIRTREYLLNKSQIDQFSVTPTSEKLSETGLHGAAFVLFGCLFDSIKQSVQRNITSQFEDEVNPTNLVFLILKNLCFQKDFWDIAEVCYFAGQYGMAKHEVSKGLGSKFEEKSYGYLLHNIQQISSNAESAEKNIELCCYILYHTKHYGAADSCFQWLIKNKNSRKIDVSLWTLLRAHCKKEQLQYRETRELVDEVKSGNDELHEAGIAHRDVCVSYINIGIVFGSLSEYNTASRYLYKALEINREITKEKDNTQRSLIYNQIAISHGRLSEYKQSLKYCMKSLSMNQEIFGANAKTPEMAHNYSTLGYTYYFLGKYNSALEHHQKSLVMRKTIYGEITNHPEIAHSYNDIGHTYSYLAKYPSSLENLKRGLDMRTAIHGATTNHPHIAKSFNNIANTYCFMGNYALALEYHSRALDMRLAVYGATTNNSHIADSYDYIGRQHYQLGNYKKALEHHTKALGMMLTIYSDNPHHTQIADCHNFIGKEYWGLGMYSKSLKHLDETLSMKKAIHGATTNHPNIAFSYNDIGNVHRTLGNFTCSLECHTRALDMRKAVHGATTNYPFTSSCYDYIGRVYTDIGEYTTALENFSKSFEMRKTLFGETSKHYSLGFSYLNIGDVHYKKGNYALSLDSYYKSLEILQANIGTTIKHPFVAEKYNKIGDALLKLGQHKDSMDYLQKSLEMRKDVFGATTNHPDIARSYSSIGCLHGELGDYTLALEYHNKSLNIRREIFAGYPNHGDLTESYQNIVKTSEMLTH